MTDAAAVAAPSARPIPQGYHTVTPTLVVRGGAQAIDFYVRAFGARDLGRMLVDGLVAGLPDRAEAMPGVDRESLRLSVYPAGQLARCHR